MGLYVVTEPVVIDGLHYATVPVDPIEVDDELAAPLVEVGSLVPFRAPVAGISDEALAAGVELQAAGEQWDEATEQVANPRRRRKPAED